MVCFSDKKVSGDFIYYKRYTRVNIVRHIKNKHGKDIICVARKIEDLINKHTKIKLDTNFIKACKRKY